MYTIISIAFRGQRTIHLSEVVDTTDEADRREEARLESDMWDVVMTVHPRGWVEYHRGEPSK